MQLQKPLKETKMKYTQNALNILVLKSYTGIGNTWIVKNIVGNEPTEVLVDLLNKKIHEPTSVQEFNNLKVNFELKLKDRLSEFCDGLVAIGDSDFPEFRGEVKESERPVFLFYKGDISLIQKQNKNVTVIGLLNPTPEIESRERELVSELVSHGVTIVSGLAYGCDSIAHHQAILSKGKTVAILPSPLFSILPARNKNLAKEIVDKGGLLITEYGTDFKNPFELSARYKERDRLQALFCDTIILGASYAKNSAEIWKLVGQKLDSGARLAMGYAKSYQIPRAVMYDENMDQHNPMFDLNREIISERSGTIIINSVELKKLINALVNKIDSNEYGTQSTLF
jgi:DNA processing protein